MANEMHETLKSALADTIVCVYPDGSPMIGGYLAMNGIKSVWVDRHHLGEKGYCVWLSHSAPDAPDCDGGWPTWVRKRQTARALAIAISQKTGLPVIDQTRANPAPIVYKPAESAAA